MGWDIVLKKHKSITWRITTNLLVFVGALLAIIWISLTFLLPTLYREHREATVAEAVTELGNNLGEPHFSRTLSQIAREQSACIRVLRASGTEIYSMDYMPYSALRDFDKSKLFDLWHEANGADGSHTEIYAMNSLRLKRMVPSGVNAILYVQVFNVESREPTAIFYNSTITPVDGMVEVLQTVLLWIIIVTIIFAAMLSIRVSRRIAKPITDINNQARRLKNQDYSVVFDSNSYREVEELSETLNAANHEMALLDRLRRDLVSNVSHDLRTPLAMIIAFAEVMRDVPEENTPENSQIIIDEANRLSELVSDVLSLPVPSEASTELNITFYDFAAAGRRIIERYQKFSKTHRYTIVYDGPEHLQAMADKVKLSQVIYNLINNAISHAGKNPEIMLRVQTTDGKIRAEVVDRGDGIPEDKLPLIWNNFYSDTEDDQFHAGLGLTIVRRILELHGAKYGVESTLGRGSTFWFEIDCYKTPENDLES